MKIEKKYITILLRKDGHPKSDPPNLNWNTFLKIALDQGVANLIYLELKEQGISSPILPLFEKYYTNTLLFNLSNSSALKELEYACRNEEIKVLTLKGASLIDYIYPKAGMRPMSDLDLMVQPPDRRRFEGLLEHLGYQRPFALDHQFMRAHHTIDLHTHALNIDRILSRRYLFPLGMDAIWQKAVPLKMGYAWIHRPDDVDNILLLCQHIMKHSFAKLIWLEDIYRLMKRFQTHTWSTLAERSAFLLQQKSLSYSLFLLHLFFNFKPPLGSGMETVHLKPSALERVILENAMCNSFQDRSGPLLSLFCIKGVKKQLRFILENLFPGKKVFDREFSSRYAGNRIGLYAVRLIQASRLVLRHMIGIFVSTIKIGKS